MCVCVCVCVCVGEATPCGQGSADPGKETGCKLTRRPPRPRDIPIQAGHWLHGEQTGHAQAVVGIFISLDANDCSRRDGARRPACLIRQVWQRYPSPTSAANLYLSSDRDITPRPLTLAHSVGHFENTLPQAPFDAKPRSINVFVLDAAECFGAHET